jgi:uncharacterized phage protein (TIGR02218 family)
VAIRVTTAGLKALALPASSARVTQAGLKMLVLDCSVDDGVSAAMKAHLRGGTTYLCTLWKATAKDGTVVRASNHTRNLTYQGEMYKAVPLKATAIQAKAGLSPDNAEVAAPFLLGGFEQADLEEGKWDGARVEILAVNYLDLTMGHARRTVGFLGEVTLRNRHFTAELRGLSDLFNQELGDLAAPTCRYELGDADCGVNLASFTFAATVGGASVFEPDRLFTVNLNKPDGYFAAGKLTVTSGQNAGLTREVKRSALIGSTNRIELALPLRYPLSVGDAVSLVAGDDKTLATCRDKFANAVNIGCEPELPGQDKLFRIPE